MPNKRLASKLAGKANGGRDEKAVQTVGDIALMGQRWNVLTGQAGYDPAFDLDQDGDVDIADLLRVAANWNTVCAQ